MTHVACESTLRSVVRSSMHPCPGNWMAIGCAVVYYVNVGTVAISHHCAGWNTSQGTWESCKWLGNWAVVFTRCSGFFYHWQLASHDFAALWQKKWRKAKFKIQIHPFSWKGSIAHSSKRRTFITTGATASNTLGHLAIGAAPLPQSNRNWSTRLNCNETFVYHQTVSLSIPCISEQNWRTRLNYNWSSL